MKWSYSSGRAFQACQRQWFYKNLMGVGQAKRDEKRRAVHLMGKADSIGAWRGRLVDDIISEEIVPRINQGRPMNLGEIVDLAKERFDKQLAFARSNTASNLRLDIKAAGDHFALLKNDVSDDEASQAWQEIDTALRTLFSCDEVKEIMKSADFLVSQRVLQYSLFDGATMVAVPDLIAFHDDESPTIIDWKVHAQGTYDAWMQLALYAIALERCKPHVNWEIYVEEEHRRADAMRLFEVQLLLGTVREHRLDQDHFDMAEEFMNTSAFEMTSLMDGRKYPQLTAEEFSTARYPQTCDSCNFKPTCWRNPHDG